MAEFYTCGRVMETSAKKDGLGFLDRFEPVTPEMVALRERILASGDSDGSAPRLLYAGSCPKCRFLSACVVVLSFRRIRRIPLDQPEWRELYARLPEAHGYPVLIVNNRMVLGSRVFLRIPLLIMESWFHGQNAWQPRATK